jgi:hypothetical protein
MSANTHGPIEDKHLVEMNDLARFLDERFNGPLRGKHRPYGFVLLVFDYGDAKAGRMNYISNGADRADIVVALKEMVANFEGRVQPAGRA